MTWCFIKKSYALTFLCIYVYKNIKETRVEYYSVFNLILKVIFARNFLTYFVHDIAKFLTVSG